MRSLTALLVLLALPSFAQDLDLQKKAEEMRTKIERILRVQDLRTLHDGFLRGALSDRESAVRRKAFLAYASLQDTTMLPQLVAGLVDVDTVVQQAAAFAIGQTGMLLGEGGRQRLEDDLLWKHLNETSVKDRLIEEIGKFGTAEALRQVLLREGSIYPGPHTSAVQRALGRFAIRAVVSDEGVRFLLHALRPAASAPWEVVYALQRIGNHPLIRQEIEHVLLLRENADPLVRMNLAALLGKLKTPEVLQSLQDLGLHDPDWRVRANALRALGGTGLRGQPASTDIIRRAMFDAHPQVALSAIAAAGASDLTAAPRDETASRLLEDLTLIATNSAGTFHWTAQAEAAQALVAITGPGALEFCHPPSGAGTGLTAALLRAAGRIRESLPMLIAHLQDESPRVVCGALDGMSALIDHHPADTALASALLQPALASLGSRDVAVVATAAGLLRHKGLLPLVPVSALTGRLAELRVPDDIEALQELCAVIGQTGDRSAVPALVELLALPDRAVAAAAADALEQITGADYRSRIQRRDPLYTDFDFEYLRALPDTIPARLETERGTIHLQLFKDAAPFTIMALGKLSAQRGFFRGGTFHRVVPNFVIQGGDPRGDGWGGPGFTIRSEFSSLAYETGTVGIASAGKDTEGSQFFITHSPQPHLDGRYTIIGRVVSGQEVVDQMRIDDRLYDFTIGR